MSLSHAPPPSGLSRLRLLAVLALSVLGLSSSGCPQFGAVEAPPSNTEFCAASGWVENSEYQGVICFAPVDPIVEGARSEAYVLQPGPIRFVLPVESSP